MSERRTSARARALLRVQTHSFAADDLRLFLDTHPGCGEAKEALSRQLRLEREATTAYEAQYGPLTAAAADDGRHRWTDGPWPWEGEA